MIIKEKDLQFFSRNFKIKIELKGEYMESLQIACGFNYSNVYRKLFSSLIDEGITVNVYNPQHTYIQMENKSEENYPYYIYTNKIINKVDKYLYFTKIYKMTRDVKYNFDLNKIDIIHAHSLFSDGGVAYEIFKKYRIPYIVAVRNTDLNQYFKKAKHLSYYSTKILLNAKQIIFLSKSYKNEVLNKYVPQKYRVLFEKKSKLIPNGIDNFWFDNRPVHLEKSSNKDINLIFVGKIMRNKNISSIISAIKKLNEKNKKFNITIIGEKTDERYFEELLKIGDFNYIEKKSKEGLLPLYRSSDIFIMPSLTETFGLVYPEAMSQGLPVIYTRGEGFDEQFPAGEVGYGVDPLNIDEIIEKIVQITERQNLTSLSIIEKANKFRWNKIANEYFMIYQSVIK